MLGKIRITFIKHISLQTNELLIGHLEALFYTGSTEWGINRNQGQKNFKETANKFNSCF